jgi:hypothetical protein
MLPPEVVIDIKDVVADRTDGSSAIPARMAPMLVIAALIILELVLQVSRRPEKCLIQ